VHNTYRRDDEGATPKRNLTRAIQKEAYPWHDFPSEKPACDELTPGRVVCIGGDDSEPSGLDPDELCAQTGTQGDRTLEQCNAPAWSRARFADARAEARCRVEGDRAIGIFDPEKVEA
jgi:hypothetical protein